MSLTPDQIIEGHTYRWNNGAIVKPVFIARDADNPIYDHLRYTMEGEPSLLGCPLEVFADLATADITSPDPRDAEIVRLREENEVLRAVVKAAQAELYAAAENIAACGNHSDVVAERKAFADSLTLLPATKP